jgi:hypothetical protein
MSIVERGLRSQIHNIEATYGRSIDAWVALIRESGRTRHSGIVAMLKADYGLAHGAANRVALVALDQLSPAVQAIAPETSLYAGAKTALLPIHARLMATIRGLGPDIEVAPKKGYLSIRRRKQFAMIKPGARHVDLGLVLPGLAVTDRLGSAATFNALFTHRVRVHSPEDIDAQLTGWLSDAYARAG